MEADSKKLFMRCSLKQPWPCDEGQALLSGNGGAPPARHWRRRGWLTLLGALALLACCAVAWHRMLQPLPGPQDYVTVSGTQVALPALSAVGSCS